MKRLPWLLCLGSGTEQMLDWYPDENYPGAVVCIECSYGVMVRKRSVTKATSGSGHEGLAGTLRNHYVQRDRAEPVAMTYRKPRSLR